MYYSPNDILKFKFLCGRNNLETKIAFRAVISHGYMKTKLYVEAYCYWSERSHWFNNTHAREQVIQLRRYF